MSFPDDYKRVQQAGGTKAQVDSTAGLPRQLLVDETNQKLLLMNGSVPGGFPVVMEKDAAAVLQSHNEIIGDALMIAKGTDGAAAGDLDTTARLWKSGELLRFFSKIVDVTLNGEQTDWTVAINNEALRDALKVSAILVANLDGAPYSGWSRCDPATALNIPAGESMGAGNTAFVLTIANSINTQYQLYFSPKTLGKIYCRVKTAGVWGGWTLATGVTSGDLANYLLKAGDTMTGKLNLVASALGFASLKLPIGVAPTTLVEGDIWRDPVSRNIRLRKQISGVDTSIDVLDSSMIATPADIGAKTPGKLVDASMYSPGVSAWVRFYFNGTTITVMGSNNVSSVVRNAAGDYTVNFTTALADGNYALSGGLACWPGDINQTVAFYANAGSGYRPSTFATATSCRVVFQNRYGGLNDPYYEASLLFVR